MSERLLNRNFLLVLASNAVLGAPMPMLIILGGLAGILLAPLDALATVPVSVQMLAGLVAAAPMSMFMGRFGRKLGFLAAAGLAFAGGLTGMLALFWSSFWLLCLGHACLGAALISFGYFRFAAAELVAEKWRPSAISFTLGAGLVAAVLGPEIFIQTRDAFEPIPFAGAYLAIAGIAAAGSVLVFVTRYPPPAAQPRDGQAPATATPSARVVLRRPRVKVALIASAASYAVMVLLMTPAPLAMVGCGFTDVQAGDVIRWHVIAMFAPSFFTGILISRFGSGAIIATGAILLGLAAIVALADTTLSHFYASQILLGVGWNFGFVGATAMLAESIDPAERPAIQGVNDTGVALASTIASFGSGALISTFAWTTVVYSSLPITVAIVLAILALRVATTGAAPDARRS